jgi:monofunctional chorismate mutase
MLCVSPRVAFQGELGAYSEEAVRSWWGGRAEPVPARGCDDVVRAVARGDVDYGLLPIENTLAGTVVATCDALIEHAEVKVVGEVILPIQHCLLAPRGASIETLVTVESHPVALAQCTSFLERHSHIQARASYDTAGAARDVAARGDRTAGAVAGRGAAERFDLAILAEGIENRPDNQTRFLVIAREPAVLPPGVPARTAVITTSPLAPSTLPRLLAPIAAAGLHLAKLESRPTGEQWKCRYYIEIGHRSGAGAMADVLAAMMVVARSLRVAGCWGRGVARSELREAPRGAREVAAVDRPLADRHSPPITTLRAIRGATSVGYDDSASVLEATRELLMEIVARNAIGPEQVISAIFTMTPDLNSVFPACAARELGWTEVPLLCASEIPVPGSLPRCVRVLLHVEVPATSARMCHVYLREAVALRPDLEETAVASRERATAGGM